MSLPATINVSFDFSSGATFGTGFVIGDPTYGIIGVSRFGTDETVIPVVDLTPNVYNISINRGRNIMRDTYEAGNATIRVLDPNSDFNPQNTASPYFGKLAPLRKIRVSATTATTSSWLFSGYVQDYKYTYPQGQETGYVDIIATDAFRLFNMANVQTIPDTAAGQNTGTRIDKILDYIEFPSSMRSISTGLSTCISDPATARTSLEAMKNAEFCEVGSFYMDAEGTAVFKNRTEVVQSIGTTPTQFNQTTGIPYKNLQFAFDDKLIINDVTFTRYGGGTTQEVFDNDSIAKYFPHSLNRPDLVAETDDIVLNVALEYVATRKETTIRIDAMTVDLLDTAVPTDTMIELEFFDNVEITNVQPDGSTIVKVLQVQGLKWDITPNRMTATVTTLEPIADGFIIGNTFGFGTIGTSILSY
jgi:thiamine pyrophosphokinase